MQALSQGDALAVLCQGIVISEDVAKPIERNAARQMVHMMGADICSKPPQNDRKIVVRAAMQGSFMDVPFLFSVPNRVFELVLHVRQPHTDHGSEVHCRKEDQHQDADAAVPNNKAKNGENGSVRPKRTDPMEDPTC